MSNFFQFHGINQPITAIIEKSADQVPLCAILLKYVILICFNLLESLEFSDEHLEDIWITI